MHESPFEVRKRLLKQRPWSDVFFSYLHLYLWIYLDRDSNVVIELGLCQTAISRKVNKESTSLKSGKLASS